MSSKGNIARAAGLVLLAIVILVPALIPVLQQVFPSSTYAWSAILVVVLAAVAKTVEIVYRKQIDKTVGAPLPAATPSASPAAAATPAASVPTARTPVTARPAARPTPRPTPTATSTPRSLLPPSLVGNSAD